ncbi:MAG: hypothetical protein HC836_22810 [Richelia sp. RM2_1_2]|nr:hypothetical protein [Richelia sp. RM2_1_2]
MTNMQSFIYVKFQKEGVHQYPAALEKESLKDVSFLGYPHRHIFHFKITISVSHDDREIEFIQFKRWIESLYTNRVLQLDFNSCEMIARDLVKTIENKYPGRTYMVDVSEDNENGALLISEHR